MAKVLSRRGTNSANNHDLYNFGISKQVFFFCIDSRILVNLQLSSTEVERPFNLAGYVDNKYQRHLP